MSGAKKVSVVIPCYNSEDFIENCLRSVISQSYRGVEIIVVDDGSTDSTVEIISNVKDDRIQLLKQSNSGACVARNKGLEHSRGEYVIFLDSDDWLLENAIECQMRFLENASEKHIAFGSWLQFSDGLYKENRPAADEPDLRFLIYSNIVITASIYPRKGLLEVGGFDERLIARQEWNLNIRLFLRGFRFVRSNVAVFVQRMHGSPNRITNRRVSSDAEYNSLYHSISPLFDCDDELVRRELAFKCWAVGRWFALGPRKEWIRYQELARSLVSDESYLEYMPVRYRCFLKIFGVRLAEFFDRSINKIGV